MVDEHPARGFKEKMGAILVPDFDQKLDAMVKASEARTAAEKERAEVIAQQVASGQKRSAVIQRANQAKPTTKRNIALAAQARQKADLRLRQSHPAEYDVILYEERVRLGLGPLRPRSTRTWTENGASVAPVAALGHPTGVVAPETATRPVQGERNGNAATGPETADGTTLEGLPAVVKHPHSPEMQAKCPHGSHPLLKTTIGRFCSGCGRRIA